MTTGMFCWWSLAQHCPIRSWSYNRSVNRGGRTYSSCTMLRKEGRNPGPPTGNWQSVGRCQWAAVVRQYTNSRGRGYRGCQVGGLHHVWCYLSRDSLLLSILSMNVLFIFNVGMQLLKTAINTAYMMFRDVGHSYWTPQGALYQIGKSLLQVVFTNLQQPQEPQQKAREIFENGLNVMWY